MPRERRLGMNLGLLYPLTYLSMLAIERATSRVVQPVVRWWILKGIAFFALAGAIITTLSAAIARAIAGHALVDLRTIPSPIALALVVLATTLVAYGRHRLIHRVGWLWRWAHQMHHSAERVDVAGTSFSHPFDIAMSTVISASVVAVLGPTPLVAALAAYVAFVLDVFSHTAISTPRWLGYLVQRPEAHAVHHQREVHAYNYGLPLWDLVFGTFRNPIVRPDQAGFWNGASSRIGAMLAGRDVTTPTPRAAAARHP